MLPNNPSFSSRQDLLDPSSPAPSLTSSPAPSLASSPPSSGSRRAGADPPVPGGPLRAEGQLCVEPLTDAHLPNGEAELLCGWGAFRPRALQGLASPPWVLLFLSVASFLQGMTVNGLVNTVVTSIERRFQLSSSQTGVVSSAYDMAACVCLAFVSYFGGAGHKPRWLGGGMLLMALGSLLFTLPHFATPPYQVSVSERAEPCSAGRTAPCHAQEAGPSSYRFVFLLGQFLHGAGATPLYTLGVTYLDENVGSNHAPVYIGIFYTAAILGPAVGYLLGGYFLNIYTEVHLGTSLSPEDPRWVGAWWIGFLLGGAAALLVAMPILGYPRQLPGSQECVSMRVCEAHQLSDGSQASASDPQFGKSVKDMPRSALLLLKNPAFVFLCLGGATEATLIAGMSTFGPKFLEAQFGLSASRAASWFGYMVVPAGGGGTFLGGYLVKRLKLRCRGLVRVCVTCTALSLTSAFVFLVHCPDVPMAGVTAPYSWQEHKQHLLQHPNSSALEENLTAACNAACSCQGELFNPVCGADAITYYSPCHAGCRYGNHTRDSTAQRVYSGCSCVLGNWSQDSGAVSGKCSSSCPLMASVLVLLFVTIFLTFLCSIPALTATLRCVPDSQRSFGLGLQWIVVRALGSIPGPIAFGSMIDWSCLLWQRTCSQRGSCALYQNAAMSRYMLTAAVVFKVVGVAFFTLASILYTPPPDSAHNSYESTESRPPDPSKLPVKDPPERGAIANQQAR